MKPLEGGRHDIRANGRKRFRIERAIAREPHPIADVTYVDEDEADDPTAVAALIDEIRRVFRDLRLRRQALQPELAVGESLLLELS